MFDSTFDWWGKPTINFCEPDYATVEWIAEFWNTASSIPIATFALHGLLHSWRQGHSFAAHLLQFLVVVVGLGSMAFHGTMCRGGQMLDELPMLYAISALMWGGLCLKLKEGDPLRQTTLAVVVLLDLIATLVYLTGGFLLFIVMYVTCVVVFIAICIQHFHFDPWVLAQPQHKTLQRLMHVAAAFYAGGFLFLWLPEAYFCAQYPVFTDKLKLHALFHLTSCVGSYTASVFVIFAEPEHLVGSRIRYRRSPLTFFLRAPHVYPQEQGKEKETVHSSSAGSEGSKSAPKRSSSGRKRK